jgi:hypothetical protein
VARKTICLVPAWWSDEMVANRDCRKRDHRHVSEADASKMHHSGDVVYVHTSAVRNLAVRPGPRLSLTLGEWLAQMIYQAGRDAWHGELGHAMAAEIRRG